MPLWKNKLTSASLLTSAVIYGAKASGKSNLLQGMQTLGRLVVNSASKMQIDVQLPVEPFRLITQVFFLYEIQCRIK